MTAEEIGMKKQPEFTILLGRHKEAFSHEGNKRFRAVVKAHAVKYNQAKGRHEKSQITSFLMMELEHQGAVFLQKNTETGAWEKMPRRTVVAKIGHAIRDATVRYCKKQERGTNKKKKKKKTTNTDMPRSTEGTTPSSPIPSSSFSSSCLEPTLAASTSSPPSSSYPSPAFCTPSPISSAPSVAPEHDDSIDSLLESLLGSPQSEGTDQGTVDHVQLAHSELDDLTAQELTVGDQEHFSECVTFPAEAETEVQSEATLTDLPATAEDWAQIDVSTVSELTGTAATWDLLEDFHCGDIDLITLCG